MESKQPAEVSPLVVQDGADERHQALLAATCAARDRRWASIGRLEEDGIGYLIAPGLIGGPPWPTLRQAYRVIRTPTSIVLATEGLADPFEDNEPAINGFGMELFIETRDIPADLSGTVGDISAMKNSWAFALLENVGRMVADAGGLAPQLERHGSLSVELPGLGEHESLAQQVPSRFITDDKTVGVILGAPLPTYPTLIEDTPLSPVRLIPVVLLTAAELERLRAGSAETRHELVARLGASQTGHFSDLGRESLA